MLQLATLPLKRRYVNTSDAFGLAKPTIVFLHGPGGNQGMWRGLVPAFEDEYKVVLLNLAGLNQPAPHAYDKPPHGTLNGYASELLAVMKALCLYEAVFVGHSVGAMIGMLAAIREPERFGKMVLISPAPRFVNEAGYTGGFEQHDTNELLGALESKSGGWSQDRAARMTDKNKPSEMLLGLTNSFVQNNPEIARHFARVTFPSDSQTQPPHRTIPTLIVQSARDVIAPLAVGHYLNEHLADSRMVVVETSGHCPHLSAPQETASAMHSFLQSEPIAAVPCWGATA